MARRKNNPGMATVPGATPLGEPPAGAGFISDYVSGTPVRATPVEVQADRNFARRPVEDYGYRKDRIRARPQYRVYIRPPDEEKSYPIDIAVFRSCGKSEDECWSRSARTTSARPGEHQLRLYMDKSAAEVGV